MLSKCSFAAKMIVKGGHTKLMLEARKSVFARVNGLSIWVCHAPRVRRIELLPLKSGCNLATVGLMPIFKMMPPPLIILGSQPVLMTMRMKKNMKKAMTMIAWGHGRKLLHRKLGWVTSTWGVRVSLLFGILMPKGEMCLGSRAFARVGAQVCFFIWIFSLVLLVYFSLSLVWQTHGVRHGW